MRASSFRLPAADATELFVYSFLPDSAENVRFAAQIVHGMGEHAARYERLAKTLCDSGFAVYAADCRGHGRTAASPADYGHFADHDGWEKVVGDVQSLSLRIETLHPRVPRALVGHSMGSFIAADCLTRFGDRFTAAVLSGSGPPMGLPGWGLRAVADAEALRLGVRGQSALLQKLVFGRFNQAFEPARTPFDWLSRDEAEVDRYIADPACGFVLGARSFGDMARGLARYQTREQFARIPQRLPLYLFAGELDPVGGRAGVTRLADELRAAGLERVDVKIYPGGRHEMLNETNREEVTRDLSSWLEIGLTGSQSH